MACHPVWEWWHAYRVSISKRSLIQARRSLTSVIVREPLFRHQNNRKLLSWVNIPITIGIFFNAMFLHDVRDHDSTGSVSLLFAKFKTSLRQNMVWFPHSLFYGFEFRDFLLFDWLLPIAREPPLFSRGEKRRINVFPMDISCESECKRLGWNLNLARWFHLTYRYKLHCPQ